MSFAPQWLAKNDPSGLIGRIQILALREVSSTARPDIQPTSGDWLSTPPEMRIKLEGAWYEVGGLVSQPERSYLVK
jgi:hypothetical protein